MASTGDSTLGIQTVRVNGVSSPGTPDIAPRLRRNLKPASCESCRKHKLRCDHELPCGRCVRLQRQDTCVYDPAPLSGSKRPLTQGLRPILPSVQANGDAMKRRRALGPIPAEAKLIYGPSPLALNSGGTIGDYRRSRGSLPDLYYGRTAFTEILREQGTDLSRRTADEVDIDIEDTTDACGVDLASDILKWLPSEELSMRVVEYKRKHEVAISLHHTIEEDFHQDFWNRYRHLLRHPRSIANIREVARDMCNNTKEKPVGHPPTSQDFLKALRGRLELLANLFVLYSYSALADRDSLSDQITPEGMSKHDFAMTLQECADACILLCDHLDPQSNIIIICVLYRTVLLHSFVNREGDTSLSLWKRLSALAGTMTAFGLHRVPENAPGSVLQVEQRKRCYWMVYGSLLRMSVALGRPPLLSVRYTTTPPVLDVSEEDLLNYNDMESLKAKCDQYGWDKEKRVHPVTCIRSYQDSNPVLEEILEISLAARPEEPQFIAARLESLRARIAESWERLPPTFKQPYNRNLILGTPVWQLFSVYRVQLIHNLQCFLLERIDPNSNKDPTPLLQAAQGALNIVVVTWAERDQCPGHKDDILTSIIFYGIPCSSALASSLWNYRDQPRLHPLASQRSTIIQNLTLFVACLDWVTPQDSNYVLVNRSKKILKKLVDGILSPQSTEGKTNMSLISSPDIETNMADNSGFNVPDFPWAGGFDDWLMADWLNAPTNLS